jgi:hypothetical protein
VAAGLRPDLFWAVTPREMAVMRAGADDRRWRDLRREQGIAYSMAQLVGIAVGNPKKMPKFERVFPDRVPKPAMTPAQIMASMKMWSARLGA